MLATLRVGQGRCENSEVCPIEGTERGKAGVARAGEGGGPGGEGPGHQGLYSSSRS